ERKRFACAFAVASNTVRQLQIDLSFRWPSVLLPLVLDQLVITIQKPVRATEFGLAKTFPKVYADRSPGRSEVWKDHVITYDDRRDHNESPDQNRRARLHFQRPRCRHKREKRNGPTNAQVQRIHTQPTR